MSDAITLDLPVPVSVNKTRRIDWRNHNKVLAWVKMADQYLLTAKAAKQVRFDRIPRYELHITLSDDHCDIDMDNALKLLCDYLRKREITEDDSKRHMRKLTVEWGFARAGARVVVTPIEGEERTQDDD